jgi:hypothetical protein
MTTQWFKYSVERVPGEFECLARAMKKNLVRQREFSILLRLLSTRFASGSNESQMLRDASRTARNKGRRLRDLLSDLNYRIPKSKCRHPSFLIRSHLIKIDASATDGCMAQSHYGRKCACAARRPFRESSTKG